MNIHFTMTVNSFEEAAVLEKALKANGLKYNTRVDDKPSLGAGRLAGRKNRKRVGKDEIAAVLLSLDSHPKWSISDISNATGVGRSVVGRIRLGTHPLQGKKANSDRLQSAVDVL